MPPIVSTDRWQPELLGGEFTMVCVSLWHIYSAPIIVALCCLSHLAVFQLSSDYDTMVPLLFPYLVLVSASDVP